MDTNAYEFSVDMDFDDDDDVDGAIEGTPREHDGDSDSDLGDCDGANLKPITALNLEKMASFSVAIQLWNRATVAIPGFIVDHDNWCKLLKIEIPKWIDALPIPKSFAVPIQSHFDYVSSNVELWISYIFRAVFLRRGKKSGLYRHIGHIIWYPNGTMNFRETVRNLLKSDELTNAAKFHLACTFCLRKEIEKMWPSMKGDNDLVDESQQFSRYPLICYWKCYCAGKLDTIRTSRNQSVDEFMIQQHFVDNWPAIEYFFDRLNSLQQVANAISLISKHGVRFQKLLLMKLNKSQRFAVITEKMPQILANYASHWNVDDNMENCIALWYDVCDLITEERFVALFRELIVSVTDNSIVILTEIWNSARDNLKLYILYCGDNDFIVKLLEWCDYRLENSFNFLSSVISFCPKEIKREITETKVFSKLCERLICNNSAELLDRIINLYLPDTVESIEFKLSLVKLPYFNKHCKALIMDYKIEALVRILDFAFSKTDPSSAQLVSKFLGKFLGNLDYQCLTYYSTGNLKRLNEMLAPLMASYPDIISEYKRKLLVSQNGFKACINNFRSTNILAEIIVNGVPAEQIAEFKKKIIFSREGIDKLWDMIADGPLSEAEKCARLFLESSTDRKKLRTRFISRLKKETSGVQPETRKKVLEFLL
ncbi:uncharacterized protein LOC135844396 isoform X2 [Planococcus citri]|uniref:uncharacterized protein LOC135844396 isoform X2 n=1 Tax=Planococcus citri TaxID=170843 RepID=UPI0031F9F99B